MHRNRTFGSRTGVGRERGVSILLERLTRIRWLSDEGARLAPVKANKCCSDDKAREAVDRILMDIEKRRRSKA
jgi:hypothetical protein